MEMALNAKNKLGFVDGTLLPPAADAGPQEIACWKRINNVVSSWILNSISKEIASSINFVGFAVAIWKDIHDRFEQKSGSHIYQLKKDLLNLT